MLQVITSVIQNRNCMVQLINYMVIENGIYRCTIGGYALSPSYLIRDTPHKKTPHPVFYFRLYPRGLKREDAHMYRADIRKFSERACVRKIPLLTPTPNAYSGVVPPS